MRATQRASGPRRSRRRSGAAVLAVTALAAVGLVTSGTIGPTVGSATLVVLLTGSAIASGAFDGTDASDGRDGLAPDGRTAALAEHVLNSLDGIEHRRVELGRPWPQLSVGPTGVVVVDVCGLEGPVVVDADGIRRRDDQRSCVRCHAVLAAGNAARRALAASAAQVPVRTIAVVAPGTSVTIALDAPAEVSVMPVDELADALARGPVLPMAVVEAAFAVLSRTPMVSDPH